MARKGRALQAPKERNFFAAAVRDPNGPFRPKTIPNKHEKPLHRKRKHKGNNHAI